MVLDIKMEKILNTGNGSLLFQLKDSFLRYILADYCMASSFEPHFITHVLFEVGRGAFLELRNVVTDEAQDKDEYPGFQLSFVDRSILYQKHTLMKVVDRRMIFDHYENSKWHTWDIREKVERITIFRDHAMWNYNEQTWDVTMDVALEIAGENFKFLCVLQDDLAGFMSVDFNTIHDPYYLIDQFWSKTKWGMKSECVDWLNRERIIL